MHWPQTNDPSEEQRCAWCVCKAFSSRKPCESFDTKRGNWGFARELSTFDAQRCRCTPALKPLSLQFTKETTKPRLGQYKYVEVQTHWHTQTLWKHTKTQAKTQTHKRQARQDTTGSILESISTGTWTKLERTRSNQAPAHKQQNVVHNQQWLWLSVTRGLLVGRKQRG